MLLVFANKQDLPNAMNASELTQKLGLQLLRNRKVKDSKLSKGNSGSNLSGFEMCPLGLLSASLTQHTIYNHL